MKRYLILLVFFIFSSGASICNAKSINYTEVSLLYNGTKISDSTTVEPTISLHNRDTNEYFREFVKENGTYVFYCLTPGTYSVLVIIDSNSLNEKRYPGDFEGETYFKIDSQLSKKVSVELKKIIHLSTPQNNNNIVQKYNAPCGKKMTFKSPTTFKWDPIGSDDIMYKYKIQRIQCQPKYQVMETIVSEITPDTEAVIDLEANANGEMYQFSLSAFSAGREIGILMIHGDQGYGWELRFQID